MSASSLAAGLDREKIAGMTSHSYAIDLWLGELADDTTVADLRQELAFRDAEIERLRERC